MEASSGEHYVALDHVRAVATMLVFSWHFMHGRTGYPVPFEVVPAWGPLVFFDEGHVGVALFMTLSGYLFAKLLNGKQVSYPLFLWNRILRLLPLLVLVITINALREGLKAHNSSAFFEYFRAMARGFIFPIWPNGGWSIAVELHFYLILPALLLLLHHQPRYLWLIILTAILIRAAVHASTGEVQSTAYLTIFGRIDQFIFGILFFHGRACMRGRHGATAFIFSAFTTLYWWFDRNGGFFLQPSYPSPSPLWIILPALEGISMAALIAWYDDSFLHRPNSFSNLLAIIGKYSYSIYLLHFFFVFDLANFIHVNFLNISNFYLALPVSMLALLMTIPLAHLSFHLVERPFLKIRRSYIAA